MELLQLKYFTTVARMLNISRAAEYHLIPQPAMSKTMSKLEQELGVKLFNRVNNKLSLTPKGEEFYIRVSQALYGLNAAVENVQADTDIPTGLLRLKVLQHRSSMVDCVMQFRKQYPEVTFYIDCNESDTNNIPFDFCISGSCTDKLYDSSAPLISEDIALAVSKSHMLADCESIEVSEFKDIDFVALRNNTLMNYKEWGETPTISVLCDDLYCLMKYVSSGMYATLGPTISWKDVVADDIVFLKTEPEVKRITNLYWKGNNTSLAATLFREHVLNYYKEMEDAYSCNNI